MHLAYLEKSKLKHVAFVIKYSIVQELNIELVEMIVLGQIGHLALKIAVLVLLVIVALINLMIAAKELIIKKILGLEKVSVVLKIVIV
jgi:hypothetical protein